MAKSSEGAGNFSLTLKLMSKIAFAEGQEKSERAHGVPRAPRAGCHNYEKPSQDLQIKSRGGNFCPIGFAGKHLAIRQDQAAADGAGLEC